MEYDAHYEKASQRSQPIAEHVRRMGLIAEQEKGSFDMPNAQYVLRTVHDAGKARALFQGYLKGNIKASKGEINHSSHGACWIWKYLEADARSDAGARFLRQMLVAAACGHHSGLCDMMDDSGEPLLLGRLEPQPEWELESTLHTFETEIADAVQLRKRLDAACAEMNALLLKLRALYGNDGQQCCFALGLVQRWMLSCLMDEDRLDAYLFDQNLPVPPPRAAALIWKQLDERMEAHYQKVCCEGLHEPHPQRQQVNRLRSQINDIYTHYALHDARESGTFRMVIPTGGGKTIASVRMALKLASRFQKRHIYYVAPYKTILEQNAKELRGILQSDEFILEHHGDALVDEGDQEYALSAQRWNAPVILTSMVQFLNTLFLGKSSSVRRFHSLADSVIILDEIQCLPTRCTNLFNAAINFLSQVCGCLVILCTATQPALEDMPVPLRLESIAAADAGVGELFDHFRRVRVEDHTHEPPYTAGDLADAALVQIRERRQLLIVLNTKKAVDAVYRELTARMGLIAEEERPFLCMLTTNLCPQNRLDKLSALRERLNGGGLVICISTSLIEAGVDISFRMVIRAQAALTSIAQAAGRCNRHGGEEGLVWVIRYEEKLSSHLKEIMIEQAVNKETLHDFGLNPRRYRDDLLSPEAIALYYRKRRAALAKNEDIYSYPAHSNPQRTLYELLSVNLQAFKAYKERCIAEKTPVQLPMAQAYRTAGEDFAVIEEYGVDVLTPYGEGADYICELETAKNKQQISLLLRRAQRYMVSIPPFVFQELCKKHCARVLENCGVRVLEASSYDADRGWIADGSIYHFDQFYI